MGQDAIWMADGQDIRPTDDEAWRDWVSATATRAFFLDDPLLDWMSLYGEARGFIPDPGCDGYDSRTDFTPYILEKGAQFETAVYAYLADQYSVTSVAQESQDARSLDKAVTTFTLLQSGAPIVIHGVLWDAKTRAFGVPDLLVRSDVLHELFPQAISPDGAALAAPDLNGDPWHYRVIDAKFTTLHLSAAGDLDNSGSAPAYKAQLFLYNQALGRLQGYLPPLAYLLGRSYEQTIKGKTVRGTSAMDILAPCRQNYAFRSGPTLADRVVDAISWVRRVRYQGHDWQVLPEPSVPELYPNMGNTYESPWAHAKNNIAAQLEELTLLWQVGYGKRVAAHESGVRRWREPACTAASVGVNGPKQNPVLQAMLTINQQDDGPSLLPAHVESAEDVWRTVPALEFFVDFETTSDLDDDLATFPTRGGQPMIFMIGCGHMEGGAWIFKCFTTDALEAEQEADIIDAWLAHMQSTKERSAPDSAPPTCLSLVAR